MARVLAIAGVSLSTSALLAGCGDTADRATAAPELPVLTLSEPSLEIGVLEGDDELVFAAIESVVRLPDGTIAVSDAGRTRISVFDARGDLVRSWGSQGDGPGEFRSLSRIYPLGSDSIMAAERHSGRLNVFDLRGELGRLQPGREISGDSAFTLDSWLSGRFWIEGALTADERAGVRSILAGLSPPSTAPGYRFVQAADDGALWIREPRSAGSAPSGGPAPSGEPTHTWTRVTGHGPDAIVTTPAAFHPTHVRSDEVLGVWSGESGVHFVRAYEPVETGRTAPAPTWLTASGSEPSAPSDGGAAAAPTRADPADRADGMPEGEVMDEIRGTIRSIAGAQERHYAGHMTYTTAIDSLERFEPPESIGIDILRADPRGWIAVFTHPALDRVCGLAYGFGTPPGWMPGAILCGPEAGAARAAAGTDRTGS